MVIEISADLTQAVTLEIGEEKVALTPRPEGFSPVHRVILRPGGVTLDDLPDSTGKFPSHLLNSKLRLHPTIAAYALGRPVRTLRELLGGEEGGEAES